MVSKYDFISPFCKVAILTQPGTTSEKRYPFWTSGDQANPATLSPIKLTGYLGGAEDIDISSLAFVSSVDVTLRLGGISEVSVVLTPPLPEARKLLESTLLEYAVSALEVQFGYSTGPEGPFVSPPFQGILQPPEVSFGTDVTINMKAIGTAGYYLTATGGAGSAPRQSRRAHIEALVKKIPQVAPFDLNDSLLDEAALKALEEEVPLVNSGKSYMHLIYQLARQCGCWVQTVSKEGLSKVVLIAYLRLPHEEAVAVLALYDFPYGNEIGSGIAGRGVYPILSVSIDEQAAIFLGPWAKKLFSPGIDPKTLEEKTGDQVQAGPASKTTVVSGTKGSDQVGVDDASTAASATIVKAEQDAFVDKQRDLDNLVQQLSNTDSKGIQMTVETIGLPDAIPGTIYRVTGLGSRISGFYTLFEVKHTVSSSGYTSSLQLKQNSRLMVMGVRAFNGEAYPGAQADMLEAEFNALPKADIVNVRAVPQNDGVA